MAEDTEKKFHSIMEKLFSSPKSNLSFSSSSPSNAQNTRGQKRPYSEIKLTSKQDKSKRVTNVDEAPPCRPWDRRDLIRRLATFKSMTWFAKPKVIDAVSCARRGWVNIDMDIVACEVCGTRLQFSTTPSWSREQVEKSALVLSLKLDSGHKLLCPWRDNECDKNLALFPPTSTPVLVDHYKERSASVMQLSALPVISASVLESMRSLQLEHFLKQSIAVECGEELNGSSLTEYLGSDVEAVSANSYYQAHRVLSLCGWEPRLLPYTVDCTYQSKQSTNNTNLSGLSHIDSGENNNKLSVYVSVSSDCVKQSGDSLASSVQYDPKSTILECKLCGANIGLWAFTTVPKPLELIKLVGYVETENLVNNGRSDSNTVSKNKLNLTIGGGPPPKQQNFRAKISLPIIGRNIRSRFSYELSQLRNTSEEGRTSHNAIEEVSMENIQTLEVGTSGSDNLPAIEEVSSTGHQDDVGVSELSAVIVGEGSNLQQKPKDSIPLTKETSSVANDCLEENGGVCVAKLALQQDVPTTSIQTDISRGYSDKNAEFHPIKQHRYFCPWITSTGTIAPGWQQTLSALQKEKVFSLPESKDSPSSPSLIKVDDPITCIRKLFESPPAKRLKPAST